MDGKRMIDFCEFLSFLTVYQSYKELIWVLLIWNITRIVVAGPLKASNS